MFINCRWRNLTIPYNVLIKNVFNSKINYISHYYVDYQIKGDETEYMKPISKSNYLN
jgi:hypothetical protein